MPPTSISLCLVTGTGTDGIPRVLLGHKKTGLGQGKVIGLSGHVEPGETLAGAAVREVKEESGLTLALASLTRAAQVTFLFPAHPAWDMDVAVFTCAEWSGELAESDEVRPQWFPVEDLPYGQMWADVPRWLPRVLSGERLRAVFRYADDNETLTEETVTSLD